MTKIALPNGQVIDFGDMSPEGIEEEINTLKTDAPEFFEQPVRARRATVASIFEGDIPRPGQEATQEERIVATNDGEIKDAGFQFFYGRADDDSEREKRLTSEFGPGSFIRRGYDDYLLDLDMVSEEKKAEYNLPGSGTINVNKPGFTRYDIASFGGNELAPLAASLGVGLMSTGVGIIPGSLLMAAAGATGKAFDEIIIEDKIEKMNTQTDDEVYKDIALTGMMYGAGELLGRGIFAGARRILKGPGPKASQRRIDELTAKDPTLSRTEAEIIAREEAKAELRRAVKEGARPTVEEVSGKAIAGRLQAIYEGIFPNRAAANSNRKFVESKLKQFRDGELSEESLKKSLEEQASAIRREVDIAMKDADIDEASKIAKKHLEEIVDNEFKIIQDLYNPQKGLDTDLQVALSTAARLFEQDSQVLYKKAEALLDEAGAQGFSPGKLQKVFKDLQEDEIFLAASRDSAFTNALPKYVEGLDSMSLTDLTSLKSAIRMSSKDPGLVPNILDNHVKKLITAIDDTIEEGLQAEVAKRAGGVGGQLMAPFEEGILAFKKADRHYSSGIQRFRKGAIDFLEKDIKSGMIIGPTDIVNKVVVEKNPKLLGAVLKAVTPSGRAVNYFQKGRGRPEIFAEAAKQARQGDILGARSTLARAEVPEDLIPNVPDFASKLAPDDPYIQYLSKDFAKKMDDFTRFSEARANPAMIRNGIRDSVAREWMEQNVSRKKGVVDGPKFAQSFEALGNPLQNVLFGRENAVAMRSLLKDWYALGSTNKKLSEELIEGLSGKSAQSIRQQAEELAEGTLAKEQMTPLMRQDVSFEGTVKSLKRVFDINKQQSEDALFRAINSGKLDNAEDVMSAVISNPGNYRRLMAEFGKEVLSEPLGVKDLAMTRLINAAFPEGVGTEEVAAGVWGSRLKKAIAKLDEKKGLTEIFKDTPEVLNDLKRFADLGERISSQPLKGKGGLAAAAFAAGVGTQLLTAPISLAGTAAGIFVLGRVMRQKWFLNSLLNPRFEAPGFTTRGGRKLYERAMEAGADIDPVSAARLVQQEVTDRITQEARLVTAALAERGTDTGTEMIREEIIDPAVREVSPVVEETVEEVTPTLRESAQGLSLPDTEPQASLFQQPRPMAPGLTAAEGLRRVEMDKLLGIA
jgi:hypothetical protein